MKMKICCVIITHNSPNELNITLKALSEIECPVIVSDDSDPDFITATKDVCIKWNAKYLSGPRLGPVANRYSVIPYIMDEDYSHVLFLDDDMTLSRDHFNRIHSESLKYPSDIICVSIVDGIGGKIVRPTDVNWKGVRCIISPAYGGAGLSDNCMLWPLRQILEVEWDTKIRYGYAEAWLGEQAKFKGINIRIMEDVTVLHRCPARGTSILSSSDLELARIYYNFLICRMKKGLLYALIIFVIDAIASNGKHILTLKKLTIPAYIDAINVIKSSLN